MILNFLLNLLDKPNSERMKGALYLLGSRTYMYTCLRDWRFVPKFIIQICQAQHDDKVCKALYYNFIIYYIEVKLTTTFS